MNSKSAIHKVVVIGSSAGGINALIQVISGIPVDVQAAIIVVQHLKTGRETSLPQLLETHSSFGICLARDGDLIESGMIYVAEPGKHLRIEKDRFVLDLSELVNYVRPSIDVLFVSAALAFGSNVIGVVLSGTGRDGTYGCKEIKEKKGVTIAQDEKTSAYFTMPGAAIRAGVIDYVLPLDKIAEKIVALIKESC